MNQRPAGTPARNPWFQRLALSVPEGVPLELDLATRGERAAAFLIDLTLLLVLFTGLAIVLDAATDTDGTRGIFELAGGGWWAVVAMLLFFLLRSGFFLALELRGRGRSPGKRMTGLRVVDAAGGPLRVEAIVARNLLREVELWLPLTLLVAPEQVLPGDGGLLRVLSGIWVLGLLLFPVFHPSGARLGDLVAGTRVVRTPQVVLLPELSRSRVQDRTRVFTAAQLSVYGIYELQMLEKALRIEDVAGDRRETLLQVSRLVRKKLDWQGDERDRDAEPFLREFYAALREHLEGRLRLGQRKRDKHDRRA